MQLRLLAFIQAAGLATALVTSDPSQATSSPFDYVIVGGGTAGLAVAAR